jgi:hypothetical protein
MVKALSLMQHRLRSCEGLLRAFSTTLCRSSAKELLSITISFLALSVSSLQDRYYSSCTQHATIYARQFNTGYAV